MTPAELAKKHPRLWHLTTAGARASILELGLLCTRDILEKWEVEMGRRRNLMTGRRIDRVPLDHPAYGHIVINDNRPLSVAKLAKVLDDGLSPADWLRMLNERVFFFTSKKPLETLQGAQLNRGEAKDLIEVDTLALATRYWNAMEIVPFNSGNTNYAAARRGIATFAPLRATSYEKWRWRRGRKSPDTIKEVAIRGSVSDLRDFVIETRA